MIAPARIRAARRGDRAAIVAFNLALALETESKVLDPVVLGRGVERALADPDRLRYWVAEAEGVVVGQAAVTREWSDWRDGWIWWFQSVYVVPDRRRRGVFRALFETIRAEARSAGDVIGLRLYVENANHRAHRTYEALGLKPGGYHVYEDLWLAVEGAGGPRPSI
jgi:GNAT superfamily N-acetyltransferase